MKINSSHFIAIGLAGAMALWIISGIATKAPTPAPNSPAQNSDSTLFSVQVQRFQNKIVSPELILHGTTQPNRKVNLSAEISGAVIDVVKREGDYVKTGDLILKIDPQDKPQRLVQAKALVKQRNLEFKGSKDLAQQGLQNAALLAQSEALLAQAAADLKQLQVQLKATSIVAPFDGVLESREVEKGTYVRHGDPLISVLDYNPFVISGHVSEKDVSSVNLNRKAYGRLITGESVEGKIRYVSSLASKTTRTFTVELEVPNPDARMADGLTADILIPLANKKGVFVSPALLSLNDQGVLGIKFVDANDKVVFGPVALIKAQADGVWISGLPDEVNIITIGQNFVSNGDTVKSVQTPIKISTKEMANKVETPQP